MPLDFSQCRVTRIRELEGVLVTAADSFEAETADRALVIIDVTFRSSDVGVTRSNWAANYIGDCDDILTLSRRDGVLVAEVAVIVPTVMLNDVAAVETILLPHLARFNLRFIELELFPRDLSDENCEVRVVPDSHSKLEELVYAGCLVRDVVMASPSFSTTEELFACFERGEFDSLLGVAESVVLDAERTHYVKYEGGRLELAIDVAAFANSGQGGVLCDRDACDQGLAWPRYFGRGRGLSDRPRGVDTVSESDRRSDFPWRRRDTDVRTETSIGETFGILVPRQVPSRHPFIVREKAKRDAKNSLVVFQVPVRTGDSNLSMRVEHIHSAMKTWSD